MKCIYYYVVINEQVFKMYKWNKLYLQHKNEIYEIYKLTQNIDVKLQMLNSHRVYNFI